jgi:hypothetical protein
LLNMQDIISPFPYYFSEVMSALEREMRLFWHILGFLFKYPFFFQGPLIKHSPRFNSKIKYEFFCNYSVFDLIIVYFSFEIEWKF